MANKIIIFFCKNTTKYVSVKFINFQLNMCRFHHYLFAPILVNIFGDLAVYTVLRFATAIPTSRQR
jgi:hypothetical protein